MPRPDPVTGLRLVDRQVLPPSCEMRMIGLVDSLRPVRGARRPPRRGRGPSDGSRRPAPRHDRRRTFGMRLRPSRGRRASSAALGDGLGAMAVVAIGTAIAVEGGAGHGVTTVTAASQRRPATDAPRNGPAGIGSARVSRSTQGGDQQEHDNRPTSAPTTAARTSPRAGPIGQARLEVLGERDHERRRQVVVVAIDQHLADDRRAWSVGHIAVDRSTRVAPVSLAPPPSRGADAASRVPPLGRRAALDRVAVPGQAGGDVVRERGVSTMIATVPGIRSIRRAIPRPDAPARCRGRSTTGNHRFEAMTTRSGRRSARRRRRSRATSHSVYSRLRLRRPDRHVDEDAAELRERDEPPATLLGQDVEGREPVAACESPTRATVTVAVRVAVHAAGGRDPASESPHPSARSGSSSSGRAEGRVEIARHGALDPGLRTRAGGGVGARRWGGRRHGAGRHCRRGAVDRPGDGRDLDESGRWIGREAGGSASSVETASFDLVAAARSRSAATPIVVDRRRRPALPRPPGRPRAPRPEAPAGRDGTAPRRAAT